MALLEQLSFEITQGQALSVAMQNIDCFDSIYLQFIRIGEANGDLPTALGYCTHHREKNQQLLKQIKSALIYPMSVLITACVVLTVMLVWVIPQFSNLFNTFGADLPKLTLLTLELSRWFQAHCWQWLASWFVLITLITIGYKNNQAFRFQISMFTIRIPILGKCIIVGELARFNLLLCNGIQAGLPLITTLDNASLAVRNDFLRENFISIKHRIKMGMSLSLALQTIPFLPPIMLNMIKIGEISGTLSSVTAKLASLFEQQLNETTDKLGQLIEPLIIVFLGALVGGLVLSMYLPIFSLMSAVG